MKKYFLFFLFITQTAWSSHFSSGEFDCIDGNDDSICPQKIYTRYDGEDLVGLNVYYSGYCNHQGPYKYGCTKQNDGTIVCTDAYIFFTINSDTSFLWENRTHNFRCHFRKR